MKQGPAPVVLNERRTRNTQELFQLLVRFPYPPAALKRVQALVNDPASLDLSFTDARGMNVMHWLASQGPIQCLKDLSQKEGAQEAFQKADHQGRTPLHIAVEGFKTDIAQFLIKQVDAEILVQEDSSGLSPLRMALHSHQWGLLEAMLLAGAESGRDFDEQVKGWMGTVHAGSAEQRIQLAPILARVAETASNFRPPK